MLKSFLSFLQLLYLNLIVKLKNLFEYCKVIFLYYPKGSFLIADTLLLIQYLFQSPFTISRHFLKSQGESDLFTFGETPLTSLDLIAKRSGLQANDVVFELGCGRGRTCFWLGSFIGCTVVGVDFVPGFIKKANRVKNFLAIKNVTFRLEDILETDLTGATAIYLYGICYSDDFIQTLTKRLNQLPKGTKVITVSYALEEFADTSFRVVTIFPVAFTWGIAEVYIQVKEE